MFCGVLQQRKYFTSTAAFGHLGRPTEKNFFRLCLMKWPEGSKMADRIEKLPFFNFSSFFNPISHLDSYGHTKSEEVFFSAWRPKWPIAAAESKFLCRFRHSPCFEQSKALHSIFAQMLVLIFYPSKFSILCILRLR